MSYQVSLNAHLLSLTKSYRGAGIHGYIYQLLRHLPEADHNFQFTGYLYDPAFEAPPGMTVRRSRWDTRVPWRRIVWEQTRLPWLARRADLLHGMAFASPLVSFCPTVVTVHDLSFMRYPAAFRRFNRLYLRWITRISAQRAVRVIAVSESTRQDVIRFFGVQPVRVVTVPNGVTEDFCPAEPAAIADFRRRRGLPDRFILYLGTLEPRKNLSRLIDAYASWRRASRQDVKLVIAGARGWFYNEILARVAEQNLAGEVVFPGFVPADELPWWYRSAEAFVYPSVFEGFGLPVLEAMACGTPVIASNASSLPEVAGKAALLVDPTDTAAWTAAIGHVLADSACAQNLRGQGPVQAAGFSWRRSAEATVRVYRTALEVRGEA